MFQAGGDLLDGEPGEPLGAIMSVVAGAGAVQADEPGHAAESELANDHGEGLPLELLVGHLVDSGWRCHNYWKIHGGSLLPSPAGSYSQILDDTSSNPQWDRWGRRSGRR